MTRNEWKAFDRHLRSDAQAFKDRLGGYPCFRRYFAHNGIEWSITRFRDYRDWKSYARPSIIRQRPIASLIHGELDCAAEFRRKARNQPDLGKRGARVSTQCAREWRLEYSTGWLAAQNAA